MSIASFFSARFARRVSTAATRAPLFALCASGLLLAALAVQAQPVNSTKTSTKNSKSPKSYGAMDFATFAATSTAERVTVPNGADSYTLHIPGVRQPDGTWTLGQIREVKRPAPGTFLKGHIIIKTKQRFVVEKSSSRFQSSALMSTLDAYNVKGIRTIDKEFNSGKLASSDTYGVGRIYDVRVDATTDIFTACRELSVNPEVEYAEPVYIDHITDIPNDARLNRQYSLELTKTFQAWDIQKGDSTLVIAVVDSGVDWEHEDLAANIWTNPGESGRDAQGRDKRSNGVDDDNNGKTDDWHGWDLIGGVTSDELNVEGIFRPDNDPKPRNIKPEDDDGDQAHGTHCAGILGAVANNGRGIAGSSFKCSILPVKCGSDAIDRSVILAYEGILYAAQMGAKIISNSWGGTGRSQYAQDVVNAANAMGSVVVVAAGNNGFLTDNAYFPASYDNVLTVGASNPEDVSVNTANGNFFGSNFGVKVDVYAPGFGIQSTVLNNKYEDFSGTSMACPFISGVAGLLRLQHPDWSVQQIAHQLRSTSDDIFKLGAVARNASATEPDPQYFGRVNTLRALSLNRKLNDGENVLPGISYTNVFTTAQGGTVSDYQPYRVILRLQNYLSNAKNLTVTLTPLDTRSTVLTPRVTLGELNTMEQKTAGFDVQLAPQATASNVVEYLVTYRATAGASGAVSYINYERITVSFSLTTNRSPLLVVSPTVDFGATARTPLSPSLTNAVTLRNVGNQTIIVSSATITNAGANDTAFALTRAFAPITIAAGGTTTLPVRFTPDANVGERSATLTLGAYSDGVVSGTSLPVASNYVFESTRGTYNEFTDGTRLAGGAAVDDEDFASDIGFSFRFGTRTFTSMRVSSNGFIAFEPVGSLSPQGMALQVPISNRGGVSAGGFVCGYSSDLQSSREGDMRVKVEGSAPNRVCVIQWRKFSFFDDPGPATPATDADLNFQIRLYEGSNRIEFVYGVMRFTGEPRNALMSIGQVGLAGPDQADFLTRRVLATLGNTWESSIEGTAGSACQLTSTLTPPSGLVYGWTLQEPSTNVVSLQRTAALRGEVRGGAFVSSTTSLVTFRTTTTGTNTTQTLWLRNTGTADLTVSRFTLATTPTTPAGTFRVLDSTANIKSGDSARISIQFAPTTVATFSAALRVEGNAPTFSVPLTAVGTAPTTPQGRILRFGFTGTAADLGPSTVLSRFDRIPQLGTGTLTPVTIGSVRVVTDIEMRNRGTEPLSVTGVTLTGVGAQEFAIEEPKFPLTISTGQSVRMRIRYAPVIAGEKVAAVRVEGNIQQQDALSLGSVMAVPKLIATNPRTANDVLNGDGAREYHRIDFPATEIGTTGSVTFRLQRSTAATAAATVSSIRITGASASEFVVDTATTSRLPLTFAAGEGRAFPIRFRPTRVGQIDAQLEVTIAGDTLRDVVSLRGYGIEERRLDYPTNTIIFATTEPGKTSDSRNAEVFGASTKDVTLRATARIVGRDSAEFTLTSPITANKILKKDSSVVYKVQFAPKSAGIKQARLLIESDAAPVFVNLLGTAAAPTTATLAVGTFRTTPEAMIDVPVILSDRKNVQTGTQIEADLRFNASLLEPVGIVPTGRVVDGQRIIPLSLTVGADSVLTTLRFRTALGNDTATALRLGGNSAGFTQLAARSGRFALTNVPSISIVGDTLRQFYGVEQTVQVRFSNRQFIPVGTTMNAALQYNASLLLPKNQPASVVSSVASGQRTLSFRVPRGGSADSTVTLAFTPMIGNAPQTALRLTTVFASGLVLRPQGAQFELQGLNQAGGTHLFTSDKATLAVVKSGPNPSNDEFGLTFTMTAPSAVTLTVTDVYGKVVKSQSAVSSVLGSLDAGEHTVQIPVSDLPTGTYFVTVRSAHGQATVRMQTLK